jgi:ribokinase
LENPNSPQGLFDVIVCGSLHLDIVVSAAKLPKLDETAVGSSWRKICGGKGGNQAIQAAKAGAKTAMIGRIGSDEFGQSLIGNLNRGSVDTTAVSFDDTLGSGMSVAILQDDGDYGAVIVSGANLGIKEASLKQTWRQLGGARVLVLQNEVPHPVNVAAAQCAKKAGALVILNAAPARKLDAALLDVTDVLIVNRIEAEDMCGFSVNDQAAAVAALPQLAGATRAVVITLGGAGLVAASQGGLPVYIPALPVTVTSTHGAGDCFVGALAAHIASGGELIAACHVANRAAANHVSGKQTT